MTKELLPATALQASAADADEKVQEKKQAASSSTAEPTQKEPTLPSPPSALPAPLAPRLIPRNLDGEEFMTLCVACDEDDALDDADDPYVIIGNAVGKSSLQVRLLYDDFLTSELQQLWPEVPDEVVTAAKARLWVGGVRGQVGSGQQQEELQLEFIDLAFLSETLGRIFGRYDSRDPLKKMASYLPVSKSITGATIILQHRVPNGRWLGLKLLKNAPLPPATFEAWGDQQQHFLNAPLHTDIHRKYSFWAFKRNPERAGCGCNGNAP